jgi:hypothetical protein
MKEYNEIMTGIIKKGKPVSDTLIEMLEEAGNYDVISESIQKRILREMKCRCNAFGMPHKPTTICEKKGKNVRKNRKR